MCAVLAAARLLMLTGSPTWRRPPPGRRYARKHFPSTRYLDYAISVEGYTLQKVGSGTVCACFG